MLYKLLVKEVVQEDKWGQKNDNDVKIGTVAFDFEGNTDDYEFELKKGQKVAYLQGSKVSLDGEEYTLVSLTQLIKSYE